MTELARALLLGVAFFMPAVSLSAQELPAGFGWFAAVANTCWVGQFPDGRTEHTQCYTSQFGKFLRGSAALATITDGRRNVTFEGDSVFAWDEASKRIVYYIWGSDGSHRQLSAEYAGDELHFPVPTRADPARLSHRSAWRRVDTETIEVRRQRPTGTEWTTELTVTYRKRSP